MPTLANPFPKDVSEARFQAAVLRIAALEGWRTAHFRPAQNSRGQWRTAVAADGNGYPDLTLARDGEVLFRELKTNAGVLSAEQKLWGKALGSAWAVWRPRDWTSIYAELKRPARGIPETPRLDP